MTRHLMYLSKHRRRDPQKDQQDLHQDLHRGLQNDRQHDPHLQRQGARRYWPSFVPPFVRLCMVAALACIATPDDAHAQIRDTSKIRQTPAGWVLDFQQQPLRVVINALAEAGGLNVTTSNIPNKNVDLRMGQGLDKDGILDVLRGVVESNGLTMIETASLIRVEGTAPAPQLTPQQMLAQQQAQNAPQLHTYQLKHASAVQLAPVLTALFQGIRAGTTTTFTLPNVQFTPQGLQINQPQPARPPGDVLAAIESAAGARRQAQTERAAIGGRAGNVGNAGVAPPGGGGGGGGRGGVQQ